MAMVPRKIESDVALRPIGNERLRATDTTSVGRAFGEGAQKLGSVLGQVAEEQDRMDAQLDNAGAKTLDVEAMGSINAIRSNFLGQRGMNAGVARADADKALGEVQTTLLAKATTPRMKAMLGSILGQRVQSTMDTFSDHVRTQMTAAEDDASVARYGASAETAVAAVDPAERLRNIDTGLAEIGALGQRRGWDPAMIEAEKLKYQSGIHASVFQNMMTTDNIDGAVAYHNEHAGQMSAADNARVATMLKDPLERRDTLNSASQVLGMAPVAGTVAPTGPIATPGVMHSGILAIEGGTDRNGRFLTSPKGAVGPGQIMPDTGPEAAKLAGLPWDAKRFASDAAYNTALSKAYFDKQLATYGDPLKAAAAYNQGPGKPGQQKGFAGTMARATAAGEPENWIKYAPKETRDYVNKFKAVVGSGVIQQQPERHDLNQILARADTLGAQQGWSPEKLDRVKTELQRRVSVDETLVRRQEDDYQRRALDSIANLGDNGFTSLTQLPPEVRAGLSSADRLRFMDMATANLKASTTGEKVKSDGDTSLALNLMAIQDRGTFVQQDLRMYRDKVTPGEFASLAMLQTKMKTGQNSPDEVSHSEVWSTISRYAPDLGLDLGASGGKAKNPADRAAASRIFNMMKADLQTTTEGKRKPTDDEVKAAFDRSVREVRVTNRGAGFFGGDVSTTKRLYEVQGVAGAVPPVVRSRIMQSYRRTNGRDPSEGEISSVYTSHKGKPGFWN